MGEHTEVPLRWLWSQLLIQSWNQTAQVKAKGYFPFAASEINVISCYFKISQQALRHSGVKLPSCRSSCRTLGQKKIQAPHCSRRNSTIFVKPATSCHCWYGMVIQVPKHRKWSSSTIGSWAYKPLCCWIDLPADFPIYSWRSTTWSRAQAHHTPPYPTSLLPPSPHIGSPNNLYKI